MTTVRPHPANTAVARTLTRTGQMQRRVTGTPNEVATTIALVRQSGRFLAVTTPRQLHRNDPRVTVIVTLRDTTPAPVVQRRTRRWVKPTVITGTAAAGLAATGYGLHLLTRSLVAAVTEHAPAIVGGLVLLALVAIAIARLLRGGCPGLHCSGCGRH